VKGAAMSNGKTIALSGVLFFAIMLAAYALMRLHTSMNREEIAQTVENARERISAAVGRT
jgi:hypothetical protein